MNRNGLQNIAISYSLSNQWFLGVTGTAHLMTTKIHQNIVREEHRPGNCNRKSDVQPRLGLTVLCLGLSKSPLIDYNSPLSAKSLQNIDYHA